MKNFRKFVFVFCSRIIVFCLIVPRRCQDHGTEQPQPQPVVRFLLGRFSIPDDRRIGWYNVKAGESKTFTFKGC